MEYTELIEEAIATEDSVERMALIAAFAISTYASTKHRSGRKPLCVIIPTPPSYVIDWIYL